MYVGVGDGVSRDLFHPVTLGTRCIFTYTLKASFQGKNTNNGECETEEE